MVSFSYNTKPYAMPGSILCAFDIALDQFEWVPCPR